MLRPGNYCIILFFLLWLSCAGAFSSPAQDEKGKGNVHYNVNIHSGIALPHNDMLIFLNREYIRSLELNAWFVNPGSEVIHNTQLGAGYFYSNLGNKNVLGNIHAVYLSLLSPFLSDYSSPDFKLNLGIAYATKKYDVHNNYFNRGIGSDLNMYGQVSITWKIPLIDNRWIFRPGMSFHHVSNGAVVSPNSGVNMFTLSAGLDFMSDHVHSGRMVLERDTIPHKKHRFSVTVAPGIKQMDRRIDKHIITSSLIFDYGYYPGKDISIGMVLGLYYNETWAYHPYFGKDETLSPFQSALHLSLQKDVGPLAFFVHPGTYIYMPVKETPYFAGRLGLRYKFKNNMTAHFAIKHHWFAVADYFEWGIGYQFNR
ncbi:MAG: acyloxyacyl hydrolase [Bacteroidales bacterium]